MTRPDPSAVAAQGSVRTELERVARRWQQLPLDRALRAVPVLRPLVQDLADEVADSWGTPCVQVPDLGAGVLVEQLRVVVYDYTETALDQSVLASRLTGLRRSLP